MAILFLLVSFVVALYYIGIGLLTVHQVKEILFVILLGVVHFTLLVVGLVTGDITYGYISVGLTFYLAVSIPK